MSNGFLVGNGGGLAEMQALFLDQSVITLLSYFDEYSSAVKALKESNKSLVFDSACTEEGYFLSKRSISISSCKLYSVESDELGLRPLRLDEIMHWVLAVRLLSVDPQKTFQEAFVEAEKVTKNLSYKSTRTPVFYRKNFKGLFVFNDIIVGESSFQSFLFEGREKTFDLTQSFLTEFGCDEQVRVSFDKIRPEFVLKDKLLIRGNVEWVCKKKSFKGLFSMRWSERDSAPTFKVYQKEMTGSFCKQQLLFR